MSCASPLPLGVLLEHMLGELPPDEDERVETHVFECDECSGALERLCAIGRAITDRATSGGVRMVLTSELAARLERDGAHIRRFVARPGEVVPCTFAPEDEYLLSEVHFAPTQARRIDVQFCSLAGDELGRMTDIPVAGASGELLFVERATSGSSYPPSFVLRVLAVDEGAEQILGEYRYEHTPWPG